MTGMVYIGSLLALTAVLVSVYSLAQDANLDGANVFRRAMRRTAKLLGVLALLAVAVYFLCKI
jgi:hypothetical protein